MGRKILVCDSDPAWAASLAAMFEKLGHEVIVAGPAKNILVLLSADDIDLAVLEYEPWGYNSVNAMELARTKNIPVQVILTADLSAADSVETERAVRRLGADFVFIKPCDLNDMRAVCNRLFAVRDRMAAAVGE